MDAFGGTSIGISILIGNISSVDGVSDFKMIFPVNGFPYGEFSITVPTSFTAELKSGIYGAIAFPDSGHDYFDNSSIPVYVATMNRTLVNDNAMRLDCRFVVGTPATMSKHTFAVPSSTSVDAFRDAFKTIGVGSIEDRLGTSGVSPVDSMVWRFVNADSVEIGNDIVNHSCIPGEYAIWGFNERTGKVFLSGYSSAEKSCSDYFIFSHNAKQATGGNCITDSGSGKTLWFYGNETKGNVQGTMREAMFPEIVTSSVTGWKAEISSCKSGCFNELAGQVGAKDIEEVRSEYNLPSNDSGDNLDVYGNLTVVSDFPANTHKYYPVAEMLRGRIAAEYGKLMSIEIYNDIGPVVGSCVGVLTMLPDLGANGPAVDPVYTDRYIVVGKQVERRTVTAGGILGSANPNETPVMVTTLTLASNTDGDKTVPEDISTLIKSLKKAKLIPDNIM